MSLSARLAVFLLVPMLTAAPVIGAVKPSHAQEASGTAEAAAASVLVQWAMGWVFRTLETVEIPPDALSALGATDIETVKQLLGQVRSVDEANEMLDMLKGQLTAQQRQQLAKTRRGVEDGLKRFSLSQRDAIYEGIAGALPGFIAKHPEVKHFIPGVMGEFGIDWRDITDHLPRDVRRDINRSG
ncbi:MAG: hypothetical protein KI792_03415 [Alphaproteobacteria bacterium]|nr:hypothetical protein [Alphaproteobacteria bacterium SS10]